MLLPLLGHMVPLNDRNCPLTIPVIKGRCARNALSHTFNIDMFKRNSTTIKHIHSESANLIDNRDVAFDTNNSWSQPKTVPVISMESMVTRAPLRYTQDFLPLGICNLIKPASMAKLISFPTKIISVML